MDIYVPKYKEIHTINDMKIRQRFKGEYRARLFGPDGRMKSDTGWKPNTILNQGFDYMCNGLSLFRGSCLGDSDTPVDVTQTGMQGNVLYQNNSSNYDLDQGDPSVVSSINGGSPDYERIVTFGYNSNEGDHTGTIREFGFTGRAFNDSPGGDPTTDGTIRVVLDAPIVKGAQDVLTLQHRLTHYPELADVTGVIDISGVNYNYLLRGINLDDAGTRVTNCNWHAWSHTSGTADDMTTNLLGGPSTDGNDYASGSNAYYPSGLTSYTEGTIHAGVDSWVKDIRCLKLNNTGMYQTYQVRLGKVSDDTPLEKLNTHTLTLKIRMYPTRYVP